MSITRLHIGPRLSQVVIRGDTIYLTGCVAEQSKGKSARQQTREILATINRALAAAGSDKTNILTATIYLADIATYTEMNAEWDAWAANGHTPARATLKAKLPVSAHAVIIVCIAARH